MSERLQILVVERDDDTRKLIDTLLRPIGAQLILLKEEHAAVSLLNDGLQPSLLILGCATEEGDDLEALKRLRQLPAVSLIPVLILTSEANPETIRRGLDVGADAYVTLPYLTHSLLARVRVMLAAGRRTLPQTKPYGRTAPLDSPPPADTNKGPSIPSPVDPSDLAEPDDSTA